MAIWFASGNKHKKEEMEAILGRKLIIPSEVGLDFDPVESGATFLENSLIKAKALLSLLEEKRPPQYASGDPVIADDSGICVDALGGRPGIYSARYGTINVDGTSDDVPINKKLTDTERNNLLLTKLGDNPRRLARFACAMVLLFTSDRFYSVQETLEGEIINGASRGKSGFGYDPILFIPELNRTAAELSPEEKNSISHRGKAARAIAKFLE